MKKKNILYLFLLTILFTACSQVDPVQYNDKVVGYSNEADKRVEAFYSELAMAFDNNDLSSISAVGKETIDSINADVVRINALEKPSDAETFHNSSISYLESLIACVKVATDEYAKVTDDTSDAALDSIDIIVDSAAKDSEAKLEAMIKAQEAFAKSKNFQLVQ